MKRDAFLFATLLLLLCSISSVGQNTADGVPVFASIENHGEYSVNLQTLDVIINTPIRSKAAGAFPFNYSLGYDSECTIHLIQGSAQWYCGYYGTTPRIGMLGLSARPTKTGMSYLCPDQVTVTYDMSHWVVISKDNTTQAPLPVNDYIDTAGCYNKTFTGGTIDGSGILVTPTWTGNVDTTLYYNATLTGSDGKHATSSGVSGLTTSISWPTYLADTFGNTISVPSYGVFKDTLGMTILTNSPATQWTWTDANGTARSVTAATSSYTQKFVNCGWTMTYNGVPFTTAYNFPDGTSESFTWEQQYSGTKTGRVASIVNRTGGTTSFSYGSMYCGASNLGPGYPTSLTRTTPDGTYTYTMGTAPSRVTTVLDPGKNKTVYTFSGDNTTIFPVAAVLTQVQKYQNTGTVASPVYSILTTDVICYNGNQTNCSTAQVSFPITEKDFYHTINGMSNSSRVKETFDGFGNETSIAKYDFGASSYTLQTATTYGSWNGSSCVFVGSNVSNLPCDVLTSDGTHTIAESRYTYNSSGFMTTSSRWTGTTWLSTTFSPNSIGNGTVVQSTGANGLVTNYTYAATGSGGCNGLLPTQVSTVSPALTTQTTWECDGGTLESTTDPNANVSGFEFDDPMFRVSSTTDQSGLTTTTSYTSHSVTSSASFGSSSTQSITTVDGLGRTVDSQGKHGTGYDTRSTQYFYTGTNRTVNALEACNTTTVGAQCPATWSTSTYLDPLARAEVVYYASGGSKTYVYQQNDMQVTLGNPPSGEHSKVSQTEYDGLGRIKSVCKILSSGGSSCGQVMGGSGIVDTYTYSFASGSSTSSVTRGGQTRSTTKDALGRVISKTTPEAGTVTYIYDNSDTRCGGSVVTSLGDLVETVTSAGTIVCKHYDALHRVSSVGTYGTLGGSNCPSSVYGDQSYTPPSGVTIANGKGRVVEAYISGPCNGSAGMTVDEWFSYDKNGRLTDVWEKTPHSGGYYHTTASYFLNGEVNVLTGIPGQSSVTYGLDVDGKPNTAVAGATTLVSSVTRSVFGEPLTIAIGAAGADSDTYGYDPATGKMTNWTFTVGSTPKSQTGTLTWNANGTLGKLVIGDAFNSGGAEACNFAYDDVTRLITDNCSSVWSQTFSYDQYDNVTKSGSSTWAPGYNSANNRYSTIGATYDGDGRLTYDSSSSYTWSAYGQMATVISGTGSFTCGTSGTCFTYDALGRMVEKSVGSTYTEMLYSPLGKTAQMSGMTTNYMYIPVSGGGTVYTTGGVNYYQHKDWLGTVRVESTVVNRTVAYDRAFAPYGEMYDNFGQTGQLNFTGDTQDDAPNNGLFDTSDRELATGQGRWISPDPAGAGWNAYAYSTNPNSEIDPSGDLAVSMYPEGSFGYDTGDYGYDEAEQPEPKPVENQEVAAGEQKEQQPDPAAQNTSFTQDVKDAFWGMADALGGKQVGPGTPGEKEAASVDSMLVVGMATEGAAAGRAVELAGELGKTKDFVTIAVTETKEGVSVVSSSENALRPAVKAALKEGEVAVKGAGHAETTGINAAKQMGLTPTGVAASRGICQGCWNAIRAAGVEALSAFKRGVFSPWP